MNCPYCSTPLNLTDTVLTECGTAEKLPPGIEFYYCPNCGAAGSPNNIMANYVPQRIPQVNQYWSAALSTTVEPVVTLCQKCAKTYKKFVCFANLGDDRAECELCDASNNTEFKDWAGVPTNAMVQYG